MATDYIDLISLGFKKNTVKDDVFFWRYGYEYFFLTLDIGNISFDWCPTDRILRKYINDTNGVECSIDEVKELIYKHKIDK